MKAHLCDSCNARLPEDGSWYVLGVREPKRISKSLLGDLFESQPEPRISEFCAPKCLISFLMVASTKDEVSL